MTKPRSLNDRIDAWFTPATPWGLVPRGLRAWMIVATFLVFAAHGAWPSPDSNETHYLGKAKHLWNASWCPDDFFLNTADAHFAFYWVYGWLTKLFTLPAVAWIGRIGVWIGLAWGWQLLAERTLRRAEFGPLAAATFVMLSERCHMAGEWVVGGIEGKSIAFVFVFFGLAEMVVGRWKRVFPLFGAAALLHVLVGGYAVIAAFVAWLIVGRRTTTPGQLWPALVLGGLLAAPSLWVGVELSRGVTPEVVAQANELYVIQRLPHHLWPDGFVDKIPRHLVLMLVTAVMTGALIGFPWLDRRIGTLRVTTLDRERIVRRVDEPRTADPLNPDGWLALTTFFATAAGIALAGFALCYVVPLPRERTYALMRYYWFRASDAYTPLVAGLALWRCVERVLAWRPALAVSPLLALAAALVWDLSEQVSHWPFPVPGIHVARIDSRGDGKLKANLEDWRTTCAWIRANTPTDALLLTPRLNETFKWYAYRAEVVTRKDLPQDAENIVRWSERVKDVFGRPQPDPEGRQWFPSLALRGVDEIRRLAAKYGATYAVIQYQTDVPRLQLTPVFTAGEFAVYDLSAAGDAPREPAPALSK